MPYIKKENRKYFEQGIKNLVEVMDGPGEFNYVVFCLLKEYVKRHKISYLKLQEGIGAVLLAVDEFKRRVLHPYEDKKKKENGDIN